MSYNTISLELSSLKRNTREEKQAIVLLIIVRFLMKINKLKKFKSID